MKLLSQTLCLCLGLALSLATPHHDGTDHPHDHTNHAGAVIDRCEGIEMNAVAVNEEGIPYFFKDDQMFKGFHGKAELANASFPDVDDHHHTDHIDAAFLMHYEDSTSDDDHMFLFLDDKVFSYHQHKLEAGYPKDISEVFPGIPNHLDAAVECPKSECEEDSVIFFKGDDIYEYNVKTKAVDMKAFKTMPNCTSAFRFMEHYYCFHGHQFSKFDPKTGEVPSGYPKETRDYFMKCSNFGNDSDHVERERCSHVHLDAITSDSNGNQYTFRGHYYLHKDKDNNMKADTIESTFKELHSEVDAVFFYEDHFYMIKDEQIFVYTVAEPKTLLEGFPKPVKEELGVEGHIDAAFTCQDPIIHIIKGQNVYDVDMKASPRVASNERPLSLFKKVDAAMCGPEGVIVVVGNHFYSFQSTMLMIAARALPDQHKVSKHMFGCDH